MSTLNFQDPRGGKGGQQLRAFSSLLPSELEAPNTQRPKVKETLNPGPTLNPETQAPKLPETAEAGLERSHHAHTYVGGDWPKRHRLGEARASNSVSTITNMINS